jgi:hypothetical protein
MYSLDELKQQNKEIADLCQVLSVLVEKPELRKNVVVCELVSRFTDKVWLHLVFEDKALYADLLAQRDADVAATAERFRASAHALKKRFADYQKQWCITDPDATDHEAFVRESRDILQRILDRVRVENEQIFPLLDNTQPA